MRRVALVLVGAATALSLTLPPTGHGGERPAGAIAPPEPEGKVPQYDPAHSLAPLVEAVEPAVVSIEVDGTAPKPDIKNLPPVLRDFFDSDQDLWGSKPTHGEGSGFIVSADGLVLTNQHVVRGADAIRARFADGSVVDAELLGSDASLDVAVLRLRGERTWPFVELGRSGDVRVGDWVVAVGNPLGLGTTVTAGIISGKGRAIGHDVYDDFLQTDAAINEGNSGGPLFDLDGSVIGINTAIVAGANTIGFAIPIDMVRDVLVDLATTGRVSRGYIGIESETTPVTGAHVAQIYDGTPAERAGLRRGDVIVAVDDQPVADSAQLVRKIGTRSPGETVQLRIVRGSERLDVPVVLAERPDNPIPGRTVPKPPMPADLDPPSFGVEMRDLAEPGATALGVAGGVEIVSVQEHSPAYGILRPGDVILEVNHWPVDDADQLLDLLDEHSETALLLVVRDGARRFVRLPAQGG